MTTQTDSDRIAAAYHEAKKAETLADLPEDLKLHAEQVFQLIDSVFSASQLPDILSVLARYCSGQTQRY